MANLIPLAEFIKKYQDSDDLFKQRTNHYCKFKHDLKIKRTPPRYYKQGRRVYIDIDEYFKNDNEVQKARGLFYECLECLNDDEIKLRVLLREILKKPAITIYMYLQTFSFYKKATREEYIKAFKEILKEHK